MTENNNDIQPQTVASIEDLEKLIERVHIAQNQFATFSEEK